MTDLIQKFFDAYLSAFSNMTVFTKDSPQEMMLSPKNKAGWFEWKLTKGTFVDKNYQKLEHEFGIKLPKSFVQWHKEYFFLDGDTSILRLPKSNPNLPLEGLKDNLSFFLAKKLIAEKLYPFGDEGNDAGPLVFDGRFDIDDNEFPIRFYDHEYGNLEGLRKILFSSFGKLLECLTHYLIELKTRRNYEIIPDFFKIDPTGAGLTGIDYWLGWSNRQKANFERFGR